MEDAVTTAKIEKKKEKKKGPHKILLMVCSLCLILNWICLDACPKFGVQCQ